MGEIVIIGEPSPDEEPGVTRDRAGGRLVDREPTHKECAGDDAGRKDVYGLYNTHRRGISCRWGSFPELRCKTAIWSFDQTCMAPAIP